MDLWIRSQNKEELIKTNRFFIAKYTDWEIVSELTDDNAALTLGHYKTKERALEVLDEIQKCLADHSFAKKINGLGEEIDIVPNPLLICNMPKE